MDEETIKKIEESIKNLESKESRIYFMVQDTKGNAKAGVRYIYQMALTLKNSGFNTFIIHEKNDYKGVSSWLGEEYMEIPHESIENQDLKISPEDFIIIPEILFFPYDPAIFLGVYRPVITISNYHELRFYLTFGFVFMSVGVGHGLAGDLIDQVQPFSHIIISSF